MKIKNKKSSVERLIASRKNRVNGFLRDSLVITGSKNLCAAMRYAVLSGGKRIRPLLVYIVGEMYGADLKTLDAPAAALEIVHSFSLVHDDLPAMDNDMWRRGRLTCHLEFDEATAILAGDALVVFAFQLLSEAKGLSAGQIVKMVQVLSGMLGPAGIAGGQDLDMQALGKKCTVKALERMYILKTSALITAAAQFGAIAAGVTAVKELKKLEKFSQLIGLAFQIQDDILNIKGDLKKTGKGVGTDALQEKHTYPALVGLGAAKARVKKLYSAADQILSTLVVDASLLRGLIQSLLQRDR